MATREEIRDWVNKYLTKQFICNSDELPDDECLSEAKELLRYLHSQNIRLPNGESLIEGKDEKANS